MSYKCCHFEFRSGNFQSSKNDFSKFVLRPGLFFTSKLRTSKKKSSWQRGLGYSDFQVYLADSDFQVYFGRHRSKSAGRRSHKFLLAVVPTPASSPTARFIRYEAPRILPKHRWPW
jgi:hypothetical protein